MNRRAVRERNVTLAIEPEMARVDPGERVELTLTVRNGGTLADRYRVEVVGLQRDWYDLEASPIALTSEARATLHLTIHPPAAPDITLGRYPFRVHVTSEEDSTVRASAIGDLTVGSITQATAAPLLAEATVGAAPIARARRLPLWALLAPLGVLLLVLVVALAHGLAASTSKSGAPGAVTPPTAGASRASIGRATTTSRVSAARSTAHAAGALHSRPSTLTAHPRRRVPASRASPRVPAAGLAPAAAPGVTALPDVFVNPATIAFGRRTVGVAGVARIVYVVNIGSARLTVTRLSIGGADRRDFQATATCLRKSVAPDDGCTIHVHFIPHGRGLRTAVLSIRDNAHNSPQTVALRGRGRLRSSR